MVVGVKTKKDERKKKKEGVLEGCLLFYFLLFCFSQSFFVIVILVQIWLFFFCYFEDSITFEYLKFLIVILFGRWEKSGFVVCEFEFRFKYEISVTAYIIGESLVAYQIEYVADECPCRQFQTLIS